MKYLENGLAKEIEEKLGYLDRKICPQLIMKKGKIIKNKILKNAQYQSFRIEYPKTGTSYSVPRNVNKPFIKKGVKNIENAFRWGKENFNPNELGDDFIKRLSGLIVPEIYREMPSSYRDTGTRILGASTTPPDPYKVREIEMPRFLDSLKKKLSYPDKISQMMAAFYSHLHLVRIHPFVDGNGRTSRTLQDIILDNNMIPPPVIHSGERHTYFTILDKAVYDWKHIKQAREIKNGPTEGEQSFYTFMAGKVNSSIDKVISSLNK